MVGGIVEAVNGFVSAKVWNVFYSKVNKLVKKY